MKNQISERETCNSIYQKASNEDIFNGPAQSLFQLFKVNIGNTRAMCKIWSKTTIKDTRKVSMFSMSLLLTLNQFHTMFQPLLNLHKKRPVGYKFSFYLQVCMLEKRDLFQVGNFGLLLRKKIFYLPKHRMISAFLISATANFCKYKKVTCQHKTLLRYFITERNITKSINMPRQKFWY